MGWTRNSGRLPGKNPVSCRIFLAGESSEDSRMSLCGDDKRIAHHELHKYFFLIL